MNSIILTGDQQVLTRQQIENTYKYAEQIISNLSDRALKELLDGYDGDINRLFNEILTQTSNVINFNATNLESENIDYLEYLERSMDDQFKVLSYNYFKSSCLPNFRQNVRNLEWGNLIQLYPWSGYLCQRGSGKCFAKGTRVVMFDGSIKFIEDIQVGDQVMGVDNFPRNVLSLHSGVDQMYYIKQNQSLDYIVNSEHELCFHHHPLKKFVDDGVSKWDTDWSTELVEITKLPAKDFFNKSKNYKETSYGIKVEGWELEEKDLKIDPYWLGLWLGDGNRLSTGIASIDSEVINFIKEYADRLGLRYSSSKIKIRDISVEHSIVCSHGGEKDKRKNILLDFLREFNLIENKHIPEIYLRSSRRQRLELLAGLLDSDGYYDLDSNYSFSQVNRDLVEQVQLLCWSLGFRCNFSSHSNRYIRKNGSESMSFSISISGKVWEIPCKIKRKKSQPFKIKKKTTRCGIKVSKLNIGSYYGFTCDGDHLFILVDGTIVSNSYEFCFAFPLWRLFSYNRPHPYIPDTNDNYLRKETCLITNEGRLANLHIGKIVEEIKLNDVLAEKINPRGHADLGKESITTESGAILHKRSYGSFIRGLHVGSVVTDDFLDKSCLYSKDQREKFKEVFYAEIKSIVEQGGYNLVSGTPFHTSDLYGDLLKDSMFKMFTYPGILPNKELLAPDRFTFDYLMELKKSLGSIVFSREILVSPVSDSSSLFPYEFLYKSTIGMENIGYVENIHSFPIKLERVVAAYDFAISGQIGADSSAFTVWGRGVDKNLYLLYMWVKQGASHNEQIAQIVSIDNRFKPNANIMESNGFQQILASMAKQRGVKNVREFITTSGIKKDLYSGLPSISAMFERGQLKVPYKDDPITRNQSDLLFSQFNSITFNEDSGKLESISEHDDIAMSSFMAITDLREKDKILEMFLI